MSKEIKELLNKAIGTMSHVEHKQDDNDAYCLVSKALALLEQPKCKTCGDRKKIEVCDTCYPNKTIQIMQQIDSYPKLIRCVICGKGKPKEIPCPDCPQPPVGEYDTRTIENTYVCPCGNIFVEDDDYDTLGSESGICCPACGNEKFITVKARLDRAEAINKDLLEVCEKAFNKSHNPEVEKILNTVIAKAKKEGGG